MANVGLSRLLTMKKNNTREPNVGLRYAYGAAPELQIGQSLVNDLVNQACLQVMNLLAGHRVLDVGSGQGQFSRLMAKAVGLKGKVVGVERDVHQLERAFELAEQAGEFSLVEMRIGNVHDLPLTANEWGSFDVAHARFVLQQVPDPLRIVTQLVKAVRPGGRVVLLDDDHDLLRLHPEPPGASSLWQAYGRNCEGLGNDPFVGRRLVSLLHQAGARPVRNTFVFFGGCAGEATFETMVNHCLAVWQAAMETLLSRGLYETRYFEATLESLRRWSRLPDAALWYPICYAEGIKAK